MAPLASSVEHIDQQIRHLIKTMQALFGALGQNLGSASAATPTPTQPQGPIMGIPVRETIMPLITPLLAQGVQMLGSRVFGQGSVGLSASQ